MIMSLHGHAMTTTMAAIITMMSIAGTSIITATLMQMTTNKPPPAEGGATDSRSGRGCTPTADGRQDARAALYRLMTWLSPLSGWCVFLFQRHRMGGRGRRHRQRGVAEGSAGGDAGGGTGFATACSLRMRIARHPAERHIRESPTRRAFVPLRERQLETTTQGRRSSRLRGMHGTRRSGSDDCGRRRRDRLSRGGPLVSAAHAFRWPRRCRASFTRWSRTGFCRRPARSAGPDRQPRVLAALEPVVAATGPRAMTAKLDDLGGATFRADIAGMRHETQYTRLFRS